MRLGVGEELVRRVRLKGQEGGWGGAESCRLKIR